MMGGGPHAQALLRSVNQCETGCAGRDCDVPVPIMFTVTGQPAPGIISEREALQQASAQAVRPGNR